MSQLPFDDLAPPAPHVDKEIITAVANLSNNLLTHTASKSLARIKQKHPAVFRSKGLFYRTLHLLNTCRYRSTVRSYILEQFDVPLDTASVRDILEAGRQIRQIQVKPKVATPEAHADSPLAEGLQSDTGPGVRSSKRMTTIDPMYRMDLDSDSDSSSSSEEEDSVQKEVLEPLVIVRGFLGAAA